MRRWLVVLALVATGCTHRPPTCAQQAARLHDWLLAAADPSHKVSPPWPTGDVALDAQIEAWRAGLRPALLSSGTALRPGLPPDPLLDELAPCPAALAQYRKIPRAPADQKVATLAGVADALGSCGCKVDMPRIKARLYLFLRGPD